MRRPLLTIKSAGGGICGKPNRISREYHIKPNHIRLNTMPGGIKKNILKAIQDAELGVAKSLILWKRRKNNMEIPKDIQLEKESRRVAGKAHEVISERGRSVWKEIKQVYGNKKTENKEEEE